MEKATPSISEVSLSKKNDKWISSIFNTKKSDNIHSMFGVVLFDDIEYPLSGWVCVCNEAPFRIETPSFLPASKFFWSNVILVNGVSLSEEGKSLPANVRMEDYISPGMVDISGDLGIYMKTPEEKCVILSEIFARIMRLACDRYDINFHGKESTLAEVINLRIVNQCEIFSDDLTEEKRLQKNIANELLSKAFKCAHSGWVSCVEHMPNGADKSYTLTIPRVQHALCVMSSPMPNDYWNLLSEKGMPAEAVRVQWIKSSENPMIIEISEIVINDEVSGLLFSDLFDFDESRWVSLPEFLVLCEFSKFKIHSVYSGGKYIDPPLEINFKWDSNFDVLSVSAGFLAANYIEAVCMQPKPDDFSQKNIKMFPILATWYSAIDKMLTLTAAMAIHAAGFCVTGYGRGQVIVSCEDGRVDDLCVVARFAGLHSQVDLPIISEENKNINEGRFRYS